MELTSEYECHLQLLLTRVFRAYEEENCVVTAFAILLCQPTFDNTSSRLCLVRLLPGEACVDTDFFLNDLPPLTDGSQRLRRLKLAKLAR